MDFFNSRALLSGIYIFEPSFRNLTYFFCFLPEKNSNYPFLRIFGKWNSHLAVFTDRMYLVWNSTFPAAYELQMGVVWPPLVLYVQIVLTCFTIFTRKPVLSLPIYDNLLLIFLNYLQMGLFCHNICFIPYMISEVYYFHNNLFIWIGFLVINIDRHHLH